MLVTKISRLTKSDHHIDLIGWRARRGLNVPAPIGRIKFNLNSLIKK